MSEETKPTKEAWEAAQELIVARLTPHVSEIAIGNLLIREVTNEPGYAEGLTVRAHEIVARAFDAYAAARTAALVDAVKFALASADFAASMSAREAEARLWSLIGDTP